MPGMLGIASGALDILPPVAYAYQPVSSSAVKYAAQAPSKTRSSVNVAIWTPDGRRCLTGTQAGEFCLWDGQTFQFETIIQAHETPVRAMTYTHAGNFLISGDDAGSVRYWRTNLELVKSYPAHGESIRQLSFAPGDLKFASASDDSTIRVWDFARVTAEQVLAGHGGDVKCVDWHQTKALLASGSKDGLVKLWCPRSGKAVGTMHGHKGTVTAAQWNSNGNWVLTSSRDQTCRVYDVRMQSELATFIGHGKDITQSSWHSVHEELFVSGGHDGSLCFWLVGRQGPQSEVRAAHEGSVWTTAWHPHGHLLATGASDAATKFWCRTRPGDPFMEQQEVEQAELAALVEGETAPVRAPQPTLFAPPPTIVGGSSAPAAIPGIGEAMANKQVSAPVDIYAAAAAPPATQQELASWRGTGGVGGGGDGGEFSPAAAELPYRREERSRWESDRDIRDMDHDYRGRGRGRGRGESFRGRWNRDRGPRDRSPPPSGRGGPPPPRRGGKEWDRGYQSGGRGGGGGGGGGPPQRETKDRDWDARESSRGKERSPPRGRYDSWRAPSSGPPAGPALGSYTAPAGQQYQQPPPEYNNQYQQQPPQQQQPPYYGNGPPPAQYGAPPPHGGVYGAPPQQQQRHGGAPPPGQSGGGYPPRPQQHGNYYPPR